MFKELMDLIRSYNRIIIHRHSNPDGDAIGSQVGLKHILKSTFPEKEVYAVGDGAGRYSFVEDSTPDVIDDSLYADALAIVLDTSAKHLISDDRYTLAKDTARLDHHIFCENICRVEITDTSFESCAGLVTYLLCEEGLKIDSTGAAALYTGMVTDSGRFRYDSTSPKTHRMAARLLEEDFSTNDIYRNLYTDDLCFIKLRAQFVLKIQLTDKRVAYIYTTKDEAKSYGADTFTISRGMVNTMSEIKGVDSWVNFTETDEGVLCEIRSGRYNINPIAVKYGGGGHAKASGATLKDREEAMALLADLCSLSENS